MKQSEIQFSLDKMSNAGSETITDLISLVKSTVVVDMAWYRANTFWPQLMHRISGSLAIALSVSIPLVMILPQLPSIIYPGFPSKELVVSTFGVLIAFSSSIDSFFNWRDLYKVNMIAMVNIKNYLADWQLEILEALQSDDKQAADRQAVKATQKLFASFKKIDLKNADEYAQYFTSLDKKV